MHEALRATYHGPPQCTHSLSRFSSSDQAHSHWVLLASPQLLPALELTWVSAGGMHARPWQCQRHEALSNIAPELQNPLLLFFFECEDIA